MQIECLDSASKYVLFFFKMQTQQIQHLIFMCMELQQFFVKPFRCLPIQLLKVQTQCLYFGPVHSINSAVLLPHSLSWSVTAAALFLGGSFFLPPTDN